MAIRRKHIRSLVEGMLVDRNITAPEVQVGDIARSMGITIQLEDAEEKLSGFLVRHNESGETVIGVNKNHPFPRRRFTIAHELGHYLLHEGELVHFDGERPGYRVNLRADTNPASDMEREANLFAAELLMPARFLREDLTISKLDLLDEQASAILKKVADSYGVSVQAITYRLANLGLIDESL